MKRSALIVLAVAIGAVAIGIYTNRSWSDASKVDIPNQSNSQLLSRGNNYYGQLGNTTNSKLTESELYASTGLQDVTAIGAGLLHSVALKKDGTVWAWGSNDYGQLGVDDQDFATSPQQIPGLPKVDKIAVSEHHNLALDASGRVWAWGLNLSGQLGNNTNTNNFQPQLIDGLDNIVAIAAGYRFSLAVSQDGTLWAWGGKCPSEIFTLVDQEPLDDYYDPVDSDIHSTNDFNNCRTEGNINILSLVPKQIPGIDDVQAVSAGFGQIVILKNDGTVWAWGCNKYGQIGRGTFGNSNSENTPDRVPNLSDIVRISAGFRHSLALDKNGSVWAWGHNLYGELGTNDKKDSPSPIQIDNLPVMAEVWAGYDYSLAQDASGNLWAWGQNTQFQFDSSDSIILTPKILDWAKNTVLSSAGGGHILVLKHD